METTVRRVGDSKDLLGESPCWDAHAAAVWWIDSLAGVLRRRTTAEPAQEQIHRLPAPVGSVALARDGRLVVALRHRFGLYDPATRSLEELARIDTDHPDVRLNDGKCDHWGNFLAATLHGHLPPGAAPEGGLYRLAPDGKVEVMARGIVLGNGPCFSPDGRTLYLADSSLGARTIWAWDYAPGEPLANRRVFAHTDALGSGPDGATVDAEGCLWSVLPRTGQIARYAPDGRLDRLLAMPATHPTSLCFGGAELDRLYVTSISRSTNLTGTRPDDGGLWEVHGLPAPGLAPGLYG